MKKKRLTAEQRKRSIIEATIRVVARLNYDRATTALIAKEAKINQALIYNHFKSKQELQLSMLDYIYKVLLDRYESNPVLKGKEQTSSMLQAITIQFHTRPQEEVQQWTCVLKAMVAIDERIREKAWEIVKENHEFILGFLKKDYDAGLQNKDFDIEMTAWMVFSSNLLFSSLSLMGKSDEIPMDKVINLVQKLEKILTNASG